MAKRCEVCSKGPMAGNNVSHAMNKTRRRWLPNLQAVKINDRGTHRTARAWLALYPDDRSKAVEEYAMALAEDVKRLICQPPPVVRSCSTPSTRR